MVYEWLTKLSLERRWVCPWLLGDLDIMLMVQGPSPSVELDVMERKWDGS